MKKYTIYILLITYTIFSVFSIFYFNGTGDSGDSIYHYLYAKYAPTHPHLFFNHWAKPVFVLLACPFAQFGFNGIKLFNVIVSIFTIFITFKIIEKLEIKNAIIGAIIFICSPLYFILSHSGLTEPLFALFLSIGIYAIINNKYITACLLLSFLPFIRSEGLIIIGVFGLYLLFKQKAKLIPLLLFGHAVYSIFGYFFHADFLWVFNNIPYAMLSSSYGQGNLSHFIIQLYYVIGLPIYILFWVGVINIIWKTIKKTSNLELQILIFIGFSSFFIAHTLFWHFGIFNSMGLKRVLLGVAPLISIISLVGFNFITENIFQNKKKYPLIFYGLLVSCILVFPFSTNKAAIKWDRDLTLSVDQLCAIKVAGFISKNVSKSHRFVYAHIYFSEILNIDPFDKNIRLDLTKDFMNCTKTGDIIIWENWFALVENGITKEFLDNNKGLINMYNITESDNGREVLYSVYERK